MEAYVTRREFEKVLKDLSKLQIFLSDTFGAKFIEFFNQDKDKEINGDEKKHEDKKDVDVVAIVEENQTLDKGKSEAIPTGTLEIEIESFDEPIVKIKEPPSPPVPIVSSFRSIQNEELLSLSNSSQEQRPTPISSTGEIGNSSQHPQVINPNKKSVSCNQDKSNKAQLPPPRRPSTPEPRPATVPIKINTGALSLPKALPSFRKRSLRLDEPDTSSNSKRIPPTPTSSSSISVAPSDGDDKIIQCDQCQLFIFSNQMENHRRNHDLYDARKVEKSSSLLTRPHKCPVCKVTCANFDKYEEHLSTEHSGLAGRPCPVCSKILSLKTRLKRHLLTHDELKFCCKICGKGYNRSDNLTAHYKTHEDNTAVPCFYCSFCNNAFASREGRDRHMSSAHLNPTFDVDPISTGSVSANATGKSPGGSVENRESTATVTNFSLINSTESERIKLEGASLATFVDEGDDD